MRIKTDFHGYLTAVIASCYYRDDDFNQRLGTRVGEASNIGPGSAAATAWKRGESELGGLAGFDQADHREGDPGDHQQVVQERRLRAAGRKVIVSQAASGLANASRKAKARRANLPVRARAKAVTMGLPLRSLTMLAMMMTTRSRPKASAGGGRGCGRQLDGGAPYAPCVEAARAGRE